MANGGEPLVLVQFRPAWAAQAYLRLAGVRHEVENWRHPFSASAGALPQLRGRDRIVPEEEILRDLAARFVDLDERAGLTAAQRAQAAGFESIVRNDLALALEWSRWAEDEHYRRVTRKRLLEILPFPLNYGWTYYQRKAVLFRLQNHLQHLSDEAAAKRVARRAYAALAEQLGDNEWMFGSNGPSALDCVVFGHLMDALREPIGAIVFQRHPNLVQFCERLQESLFAHPTREIISLCKITNGPNMFTMGGAFNPKFDHSALKLSSWADVDPNESGEKDAENDEETKRERDFREGSRNAVILAGGAIAAYLLVTNLISFRFQADGILAEDGEDNDDDDM